MIISRGEEMNELIGKKCIPCDASTPSMSGDKIDFFISRDGIKLLHMKSGA